ncbi:MAG: hypothetical protein M3032_09510 [Verrucomicrobiota bacterium]|nr:hypothetical protein [Verrucomicrobiota bacterium]
MRLTTHQLEGEVTLQTAAIREMDPEHGVRLAQTRDLEPAGVATFMRLFL